jgi:Raf kinase inhibitor-like YbhB/YbcL family protein
VQTSVGGIRGVPGVRIRGRKAFLGVAIGLMLVLAGLACRSGSATIGEGKPTLALTSSSFQGGGEIPKKFTCDGADASPELAWPAPPASTQSFSLIVVDPDAPLGSFVHWVLYNLPAGKRELPEALPKQGELPDGSLQGENDFDKTGYGGPCPPGKSPHHYVFTLYALDSRLNLPAGATRKQVENALQGHVLARGTLIGLYHR